ncbi:MAG: hypothetical protein EA351_13955 [Gemmatimonadales bacterium]|nr:MAG: hypothetical protein EA351_13955 [Gemmatimonadales bacterium]
MVMALLVGAAYLAIFGLAEFSLRWDPPREWTRKFVHVSGGLVAAVLPWLIESHWTVLALGIALAALLWGTRRVGWLQSVHGVERETEGGLYFPLAIYLLFLLAADRPVFYLTSVLVLVVADTAAAVLGSAYGRSTYSVETDRRSIEGSAVFFLMAFLSVHLPLLLLTELDRGAVVMISLQLALLVTFFEAISLKGIDNLVVPLGTLFLLVKLTPQDAGAIGAQLGAQLAIVAVIAVVAWRYRFLKMSGALALMLFFYGAWGLGGPVWVVAPTLALLGFVGLRRWLRSTTRLPDGRYQVLALFHVAIVPSLLFIADNTVQTFLPLTGWWETRGLGQPFYPVYVGAVAAQLGLMGWALLGESPVPDERRRRVLAGVLAGAVGLVVPLGLLAGSLAGLIGGGMTAGSVGEFGPAGGTGAAAIGVATGAALAVPLLSALVFGGLRRQAPRLRAGASGPEPGRAAGGLSILRAQSLSVGSAALVVILVLIWEALVLR